MSFIYIQKACFHTEPPKIGKYQLAVFPDAGHFVHEDQPAKTAQLVADFYRRNDRSALVLPPKVSDMIKNGGMGKGVLK